MTDLIALSWSAFDLLLVMLGFGLIIFIHELGHFLAAKWAGIRVLSFAIGFGPALASFRKGMGIRLGSSEPEYERLAKEGSAASVSPTEYRLNWLPLGGYVKMLGQDDLDPTAISTATDSYQSCPVWKRMVVISAGVVMNLILAAALFIFVFMHGLETEPAQIGAVEPGKPAAVTMAANAERAGVTSPGLKPGDTVIEVNGAKPQEFTDLILASAMSGRGEPVRLVVEREGVNEPLAFTLTPEMGEMSRLLEIGVAPARSANLVTSRWESERAQIRDGLQRVGLKNVEPGMQLVSVGDQEHVRGAEDLIEAVKASGGKPVKAVFAGDEGQRIETTIEPLPELQTGRVPLVQRSQGVIMHLLGLTPVMQAAQAKSGILENDIFVRLGAVEYPSTAAGISEIQRHAGKPIETWVQREVDGRTQVVRIDPPPQVGRDGKIGFTVGDTAGISSLVAMPPPVIVQPHGGEYQPPALSVISHPGTQIQRVAGTPVADFAEIRSALRTATAEAFAQSAESTTVALELSLPVAEGPAPVQQVEWRLGAADIRALHELSWSSPLSLGDFQPERYLLQAENPVHAMEMGLQKTHRVMMMTYVTFARLFQGTVKVEHLKGPVGIAHMGTRIAERGLIWLLFFMALISVNLAVINFLPLPIVDGGQFLFLVMEQIRGRPVSVQVQNVATVLGLMLIGAVFVIVTFHDIVNLFRG